MILKNVKFCSYINTIMRKWIDWFYKEKENRDLGLTWMSHGNAGGFLENHESYNKKSNWLYGSPDVEQSFQKTIDSGIPKYWRWHNEQIEYEIFQEISVSLHKRPDEINPNRKLKFEIF